MSDVVIARPPDVVFDYLSDPRNELEWNPKVRVMEKLTDGPLGVGTRFQAKWTRSPVVELEVIEFDRPHRWRWRNGGPSNVDVTVTLEPQGDSTKLSASFDATPRGPMRIAFPLLLPGLRRGERRNMELVKAELESR